MHIAWQLGYDDARANKVADPRYPRGPVGIVGIVAFDYHLGYHAGNADKVWANNNRPPMK